MKKQVAVVHASGNLGKEMVDNKLVIPDQTRMYKIRVVQGYSSKLELEDSADRFSILLTISIVHVLASSKAEIW